jgi:hypothetical protein
VAAAREASALRRAEILRDLEAHGGDHAEREVLEASSGVPPETPASPRIVKEPIVGTEDG